MFNRTAFKEVCERSGFTKKELAYIYGTTRQTIYEWSKSSAPKQLALVQRAEYATQKLMAAIKAGVLPLSPTLSDQSREKRIDVIVKTIMESMKPGRD